MSRKSAGAVRLADPPAPSRAELEARVAALTAELGAAREQQEATAEVLAIINASQGDPKPAFDAILERAMRLLGADFGGLGAFDGDRFFWAAYRGLPAPFAEYITTHDTSVGPRAGLLRVATSGGHVQFADIKASKFYRDGEPYTRAIVELGRGRTTLSVPLVKDGEVLGVLGFFRQEVRPFGEREIALLKAFAAQAVVAMANARFFGELRQSLEYQTATSGALNAISRSSFELQPMLDTLIATATRLCAADGGGLTIREEAGYRYVATSSLVEEFYALLRQAPFQPSRGSLVGRTALEGRVVHIEDIGKDADYDLGYSVSVGGYHSVLGVPLLRDGAVIGTISLVRQRVEPFAERQIDLVRTFADQAVIAIENARLLTETREALEQQTATAEVLQTISRSTFDLPAVLQTVVSAAHRLCQSDYSVIFRKEGHEYRWAAGYGISAEYEERERPTVIRPGTGTVIGRAVLAGHAVQIADAKADPLYQGEAEGDARTMLGVPLLRDGVAIGGIGLARNRVEPFTDKQVQLVTTFAQQAVIAIENARLITETQEALEQQTATAEVLGVINSSPGDLQPVFDAMLEKATRLCDGETAHLLRFDGVNFSRVASLGVPPGFDAMLPIGQPMPDIVTKDAVPFRMLAARRTIPVLDLREDESVRRGAPAETQAVAEGVRTVIFVPLLREGEVVGCFVLHRTVVRAFSDKEIALVENFAAQAVIAIENARLINETREALDQQTATAEVLQVINASPGDLAPVFEVMVERAVDLCEADEAAVRTFDGKLLHLAATHGTDPTALERLRGLGATALAGMYGPFAGGDDVVHYVDARDTDAYRNHERGRQRIDARGIRSWLAVALRKEGTLLGIINVHRREVRPFSEKQIALLQNFAAQAVIAMENARLLTETREALEQQTATAEVLGVINSSPGDLAPVWDAMLEKAASLCEANLGLLCSYDGEAQILLASRGMSPELTEMARRVPIEPTSSVGRLARGKDEHIHAPDITDDEAYRSGVPSRRLFADLTGARTALWVALRKEEVLIGVFILYRTEVRPFTDKQIALLRNFAQQAVIAMENARLLTETREALEKQTATAEILSVISSSPTDVQPTFQAIAVRATILCQAVNASVFRFDGSLIHSGAYHGYTEAEIDLALRIFPMPPGRSSATARAIESREVVHIHDVRADPEYTPALYAFRTVLSVPMLRDGAPVGAITMTRPHVEPFSEAQIELLKTFADQAVIAIENVRLFNELNERTDDLTESLEYQTATSDVLQVISRSTFDLDTILQTVASSALRLCRADYAVIFRNEDGEYRYAAGQGNSSEYQDHEREVAIRPSRGTIIGRAALEGRPVQIADAWTDPLYEDKEAAQAEGAHSMLGVPLLREGVPIGAIGLARNRIEPFSERETQLVATFADQAVIAIENARLITETREALEQQTATAEVLQVINVSPGNLQPVFEAILDKAHGLCGANIGWLMTFDGELVHGQAMRGLPNLDPALASEPFPPGPAMRQLIEGGSFIQIPEIADLDDSMETPLIWRVSVELLGTGSYLIVPLRKDGTVRGFINAFRSPARLFSEKEIALLESFAAQAVIAMDNARLLDEIRQRQAELRVTFDNMGDGVAMFDAEHRLAAWNRNFQQILDLPDEFVAPRPTLEEYIRYLAQHGEYGAADIEGEVRRVVGAVAGPLSAERTRPDGRVIELRNDPVPGGGFVLLYRDVTERKRAEAEIRAARDAAEGALRELRLAQANLIQAEKMASLGQLTAGIAHEIKNPLNFVNNFATLSNELLGELKEIAAPGFAVLGEDARADLDETMAMLSGNLDKIAEHGRRADGIVKSMLAHSRGSSGERQSVDLNALAEEALNLAYHGARAQDQSFNITLERDFAAGIAPIEVAPQDVTRVLLNLIGNGFHAAHKRLKEGADSGFRPLLRVVTRDLGDEVEVRVRDNGVGIPAENRDKLFQPFFTTKPTGEGTGLGLSISYDIVTQQHGGTIAVESEVGAFTEFTVRLPRQNGRGSGEERTMRRGA